MSNCFPVYTHGKHAIEIKETPNMELKLTADLIRTHLFNGSFRAMSETDYYAFAEADNGSLIADITLSGYTYGVIFSPVTGTAQINVFDEATDQFHAWEMDLNNGNVIQLT
jgi:hypothetical protein